MHRDVIQSERHVHQTRPPAAAQEPEEIHEIRHQRDVLRILHCPLQPLAIAAAAIRDHIAGIAGGHREGIVQRQARAAQFVRIVADEEQLLAECGALLAHRTEPEGGADAEIELGLEATEEAGLDGRWWDGRM